MEYTREELAHCFGLTATELHIQIGLLADSSSKRHAVKFNTGMLLKLGVLQWLKKQLKIEPAIFISIFCDSELDYFAASKYRNKSVAMLSISDERFILFKFVRSDNLELANNTVYYDLKTGSSASDFVSETSIVCNLNMMLDRLIGTVAELRELQKETDALVQQTGAG